MLLAIGIFLLAQAVQANWTQAKRLTWNSGSSEAPAVAVDTWGNIHVVWADDTPNPDAPEIYYKKSSDGGISWSANKRLTWTAGRSTQAAIAVDPFGALHVVWQDDTPGNGDIYYKTSPDGGTNWSASQRIAWTAAISQAPAIAVDFWGNLHVLWYDYTPGNYEIYYMTSTNGGASWSKNQRVTWTSGWSGLPAIAVDSAANLHMVWSDETPGSSEIYYKNSPDGGASWSAGQRLTWNSGISQAPVIAVDSSGVLHLAWWDNTPGNAEIYYKKSTTGGTTWTANTRLTWSSADSQTPAIAVDSSGNPYLVWWDSAPGNAEIYYKKSTNGGASWSTNTRLTWSSGNSYSPVIALDYSGNLHVVWHDNTPGNYELFYRELVI
ncbi:MAG: hypothetical protein A2Y69_00885 [Candidatus Aminicenantes bacterium RBG_13_59_9]|nr:MAG: hypothetical protein A2Y69_00885 [Candidatus Aminicenantes bacterium RBG_13_59_9]